MVLEKELQFFERNRAAWLIHHEGKFALVHGEELLGTFDSPESAYADGVNRIGNVPFLIKPIVRVEPIEVAPALMFGLIHAGS